MKNIKTFLLLSILILFTGCDVTYDLKIDKNMNVKEEVVALEEQSYNDLAHDFLIDRISNVYANRYGGVEIYYGTNKYDFDYASSGTKMGNKLIKQYKSINEFSNTSAIFKDLVKNYSITDYNNIVNINVTITDDLYNPDDLAYAIIPENININIDLPFVVTNSNADSKKGNIYTWKISETKRNANIILSFDKNRLSNHIYILNIGISYVILLVIGIIIAVSIFALFIKGKIKGINKI